MAVADVFISYKREDRDRIAPLARALEARGFTAWWDLELVAGQKWTKQIKTELDAAKCVIVAWTRISVADDRTYVSEFVENEADEALRRGVLVPVLMDPGCIAWTHQKVQYASLIDWNGEPDHPGLAALIAGVVQHAGARTTPEAVELAAWSAIEHAETAEAFRNFVNAFPQSRFASIARSRATELDEAAAWTILNGEPHEFLRRYPTGRFAEEAIAKIEAPGWKSLEHQAKVERVRLEELEVEQRARDRLYERRGCFAAVGAVAAVVVAVAVLVAVSPLDRGAGNTSAESSLRTELRPSLPISRYGLEFGDLAVERAFNGPTPILLVSGEVRNTVDVEKQVPPVRISLQDSRGRESSHLTRIITEQPLAVGGRVPFQIRVENPPVDAVDIEVTFESLLPEQTSTQSVESPSLEQAALSGNSIAQYELALQHLAAGRTADAVAMLRGAADHGLVMAQYRLAKLYERGEGVPADLNIARQWTERAAAGGNRRAMHDLGVYFARGEGAPLDEAAAFYWFSQAAELGVADSQYNVGVLYQQGRGVESNPNEALFWFLVAARQGDQGAAARATQLEADRLQVQIEQARVRAQAFRPRAASAVANGDFGPPPWATIAGP